MRYVVRFRSLLGITVFSVMIGVSQAAPDRASIGINFATEEPKVGGASQDTSEVFGAAGALGTQQWNNLTGKAGGPKNVFAEYEGEVLDDFTTVRWSAVGTWASEGRGSHFLNEAAAGWDRNLMLGYLDTNAVDPTKIVVSNLNLAFTEFGYDVYVYVLGDVRNRGGDYTIRGTTFQHTVKDVFDGEYVEGVQGNYLKFENLRSSNFELEARPKRGSNPRAPINAIEIVARPRSYRGDLNGDGAINALDIDELTRQSASGAHNPAFDLTGDQLVNGDDLTEWITAPDIFYSWPGDANLDREFNTSDLVTVLSSGVYESDIAAVWSQGDFNGDGRSNTADLVHAFGGGAYEAGPRGAVSAVPEPNTALLGCGLVWLLLTTGRGR